MAASRSSQPAGPRAPGLTVRPGVRLAVDVGSVRIGVARSDPDALLASPLATVHRGRGDLAAIVGLARTAGAVEVIVGLATTLAGRPGQAAATTRAFARELAAELGRDIPVRLLDERFTTVTAHAALRAAGRDSRARRPVVDRAAAAVLLQTALDGERSTGRPQGELVPPGGGAAR